MSKYFCLFILLFTGLSARDSGCRSKSRGDNIRPATTARSADFLQKQLKKTAFDEINTFSAKAKIFASGEGDAVAANANLIWLRDSALWLNVRKFGLEAVRALVTRDSVFVIDRLNHTYTARGLESLERDYGLPGGFDLIGHLLMGTAWMPPGAEVWQSGIDGGLHRLTGSNNRFSADYRIEEGEWQLRRASYLEKLEHRTLALDFEQFKKPAGAPARFPYFRRIAAYSPETGSLQLEIELSDVEINVPKSYRFEIPGHYERVD